MGIFEPVTLHWDGKDYTVQPDKIMGLIAVVEDIVTLPELLEGKPKLARIAMSYAAALRYAGADTKADDVYMSFFGGDAKEIVPAAVNGLLMMMLPPEHLNKSQPAKKKQGS